MIGPNRIRIGRCLFRMTEAVLDSLSFAGMVLERAPKGGNKDKRCCFSKVFYQFSRNPSILYKPRLTGMKRAWYDSYRLFEVYFFCVKKEDLLLVTLL